MQSAILIHLYPSAILLLFIQLAEYQIKCMEMEEKLQEAEATSVRTNDYNRLVAELETKVKKLEKELEEVSQENMEDEVDGDLDATTFALQQRLE